MRTLPVHDYSCTNNTTHSNAFKQHQQRYCVIIIFLTSADKDLCSFNFEYRIRQWFLGIILDCKEAKAWSLAFLEHSQDEIFDSFKFDYGWVWNTESESWCILVLEKLVPQLFL